MAALVQFASARVHDTTLTATFTTPTQNGNFIRAVFNTVVDQAASSVVASDSVSLIQSGFFSGGSNGRMLEYYYPNCPSGITSITFTVASFTGLGLTIEEWSGIITSNPVDVAASGMANAFNASNPQLSPSLSTNSANAIVFGSFVDIFSNHIWTAGTGYTLITTSIVDNATEYQIETATGNYRPTAVVPGTSYTVLALSSAYKLAVSSSPVVFGDTSDTGNVEQWLGGEEY